ncbi:MAG TPA: SDR family oxidoreductase [Sphingomicrobium sp.]|nr:SDR family oxidoreductase [Sphingomicrobium sp.]
MPRRDRVALITGASSGLGEEFARKLSKRGLRLVLAARRKERLDALAAELGNARAVAIDLGSDGAAADLVANIDQAGEWVDLLVNNAGFGLTGRFADQEPARLREMIDVNCGALTELCRAVAPQMIERRSGGILNVASTAAFQPGPGMAVYFATKAYVLSFTEALHEELKGFGVKVSALCPGPTATEFGEVAGFGKSIPKFAIAEAEPVVRAGLRGLGRNTAVVIPGLLNKLSGQGHRLLPRAALRKIAGAIKF